MASENAVYCTLLLSDHYLPGAMVLAHSLRDNGATAKLVVLYTPENLQPTTVNELRTIYDDLIPVDPTTNGSPANLWLMDRPDLISTFTKIELWRQTQFSRVVYIDCDVVALRAPDELLSLDAEFAAAPDVGWPDCFNSGVMVLRPNMQDYNALRALAERGISFDGADQGLLNGYFRGWHRLSFTYNCTPSANYQYIPAYKHFQSTINLIHFIGAEKPWTMSRQVEPVDSPYNQLLGRWWAVYDRHYHSVSVQQQTSQSATPPNDLPLPPEIVLYPPQDYLSKAPYGTQEPQKPQQEHQPDPRYENHRALDTYQHPYQHDGPEREPKHQSESQSAPHHIRRTSESAVGAGFERAYHVAGSISSPIALPTEQERIDPQQHTDMHAPTLSAVPQYVRGEEHVSVYVRLSQQIPVQRTEQHQPERSMRQDDSNVFANHERPAKPVPATSKSEARTPSKPEAKTFDPPQVEWDASRGPPPLNTRPEGISLQRQTYTMSDDTHLFQPPSSYPEAPKNMYYQVPETKPESKRLTQLFPWESRAPKPTRVFADHGQSLVSAHGKYSAPPREEELAPQTESYGTRTEEPADAWESYSRSNAWDEVPDIQRYVQAIQKSRKASTQVISGTKAGDKDKSPSRVASDEDLSVRLTDFPSEVERPSLPVTPAPIRRPSVWNREVQTTASQLPPAEGVPNQEDWVGHTNPLTRLEELRHQQSKVLDNPDLLSATSGW